MSAPIIVLSNIIIDDIRLADGTHLPNTLGGAATYAAVAARLWWDEVAIVAGVGDDLAEVTGNRLSAFGLRDEGHLAVGAHTIQSRLTYRPDGTRTEVPVHGSDYFAKLQVGPKSIPASLRPAAGTYVFRDLDGHYWDEVRSMRPALGITLWEIQDDGIADRWPEAAALMPMVDIFSFNLNEAGSLLPDALPEDVVRAVLDAGAGVAVLRMGAEGALVGTPSGLQRVQPPVSNVVDVTGGGNAFCGGFLAGWIAGGGNVEIASRKAAASAAHALAQFGPASPLQNPHAAGWEAATVLTTV